MPVTSKLPLLRKNGSMEQRVNFVTFATVDLDAARSFYQQGLGWQPLLDVPDEIVFFQIGPGLVLGLFGAGKFDADLNREASDSSISGVTLSLNVDSPEAVDDVFRAAVAAGATVVKSPVRAPRSAGITDTSGSQRESFGRSRTTPASAWTRRARSASAEP